MNQVVRIKRTCLKLSMYTAYCDVVASLSNQERTDLCGFIDLGVVVRLGVPLLANNRQLPLVTITTEYRVNVNNRARPRAVT